MTWSVYQRIIAAYSQPDRRRGKTMMTAIIDSLRRGVPTVLEELAQLGRTLWRRHADVLAYFDHHASNGPTEAINGRLEALRRNALGFRNLSHYRIRSLLHCGNRAPDRCTLIEHRPDPALQHQIPPMTAHQFLSYVRSPGIGSPDHPEATGCRPRAGKRHRFPPVFSSPAAPEWNESRFGFYPGLHTPQLPADARRGGDRPSRTGPSTTPMTSIEPQRCLPLQLMHPHFARSHWSTRSPHTSPSPASRCSRKARI